MANGNELIKSKTKLTIGMLISNRIEYIEKALTALEPLLRAIPSELILVDTVGPENSDGSLEVAKRFTDRIYRFEWCNNFAKARNVAFEHAKGEWFMFQDDDEIFEDVSEIIEFFKNGESEHYMTGMYHILHYTGDGKTTMGTVQRLVRRKVNTCFEGRIHEHFNEANLPCKVFDAYVHHYGYLLTTEESVRAHQKRNITLLEDEIREEGLCARNAGQLVREMIFTEGTEEEGYKTLQDCLSRLSEKELQDPSGQWLLTAGVRYHKKLKHDREAAEEAYKIWNNYKLTETTKATLSWFLATAAGSQNDNEETLKWVREYDKNLTVLLLNNDLKLLQQSFDSDKFLLPDQQGTMYELGILTTYNLKKYAETIRFAKKMYELTGELDGKKYGNLIKIALGVQENEKEQMAFFDRIYSEEGKKLVLGIK